jgi:hypothetical protein
MNLERTKIIVEPEYSIEVIDGSMVTFNCTATADSSLHLKIEWLAKNELIDFDTNHRFILNYNHSMTILKTSKDLDSGMYTCLAKTELDQVTAIAMLIVQVQFHF